MSWHGMLKWLYCTSWSCSLSISKRCTMLLVYMFAANVTGQAMPQAHLALQYGGVLGEHGANFPLLRRCPAP